MTQPSTALETDPFLRQPVEAINSQTDSLVEAQSMNEQRRSTGRFLKASLVIGAAFVATMSMSSRTEANPEDGLPLVPGEEYEVPADVSTESYLIGNVTAIGESPGGAWAAVFGGEYQGTSTTNTYGFSVSPNAFIVDPGADGAVGVRVGGSSQQHLVVDKIGELTKNQFTEIFDSPVRILDTAKTGETIVAGGETKVYVGKEHAGKFAPVNLTVDGNDGPGWQATYPCSEAYNGTSAINLRGTGGAQAILSMPKVDEDGFFCITGNKDAQRVVVDWLGLITSDAGAFERKVDTRLTGERLQPGIERSFVVGESNQVFVGTIVSTDPSQKGWVGAFTEKGQYGGTSTLNTDGESSVANMVIMPTDSNGAIQLISMYPNGQFSPGLATDIVIDGTTIEELTPYFTADAYRVDDTRIADFKFPELCKPGEIIRSWVDVNQDGIYNYGDLFECI